MANPYFTASPPLPILGRKYAGRGVRQSMAMQSGCIASASSLARAYAIGGSMGGEAGRSDSLPLTPASHPPHAQATARLELSRRAAPPLPSTPHLSAPGAARRCPSLRGPLRRRRLLRSSRTTAPPPL